MFIRTTPFFKQSRHTLKYLLQPRLFHTTVRPRTQIEKFAKEIESQLPKNATLQQVFEAIYNNEDITNTFPGLAIRLASLRAGVARKVWESFGNNPEDIQNLSIGAVEIPEIQGFKDYIKKFFEKTSELIVNTPPKLGYDLLAQGDYEARFAILKKMNRYYGFNEENLKKVAENSSISAGVRSLKDVAESLIMTAIKNDSKHVFIQPDNSFPVWFNAIEKPFKNSDCRRVVHMIGTSPKNKLHVSTSDVKEYYKKNGPHPYESWYLTPVGNPSGTRMQAEELKSVCETIVSNNPNAVIILDIVYTRTLSEENGKKLFAGIINNEKVINNILFIESFSKSHGLCSERLGLCFSTSAELFKKCHQGLSSFSGGEPRLKNFQLMALASMSDEEEAHVKEMHNFWARERLGLYYYLTNHPQAKELFDDVQEHISMEDLQNSCGMYVLMKLKPGKSGKDVLMATGTLGVDTPLASGNYVRFSVGTITKPTYSQYAK
jgi:aspartate/methionine/tyrosine aminotransferase